MTAPDPGKPTIQACDICEIRWHAISLTDGTCPRCIAEDAICTEGDQ
ncbi:hypothetical protein [Rhodococcus qingshengii]|nr:hypothetical protein [Rhodococcus qingshengii]MCZ4613325.1 hypothetical protein [Rhodococcus qingshengii]